MTINRKKLVKLLEDKTGMDKAEVETQLDELTQRILDAANRGKALEIKDFGLFYFDENGELSFKPSDVLDTEINFQYAGMDPVELKPSKDQKSTIANSDTPEEDAVGESKEESVPDSEDDIFGIGRTLSGKKDADNEGEEDDETDTSDPFKKLFQDPSTEVKAQDEKTIRKAGTTTEKKSPKKGQPKQARKRYSRDPMTMIIVIIIGIAVIIVGYLMISDYLAAPEPSTTETAQPAPIEQPLTTAEPDITDTEEPADQPEVGDGEVPADQQVAGDGDEPAEELSSTTPADDRYGLYGNYVETPVNDYTIVVHSLRDRGHAERTAEGLRQEGFRTVVTERTVDDRVVFRVGIGQFETIQSALNEAETLPEPYRNQNFIHRIQ